MGDESRYEWLPVIILPKEGSLVTTGVVSHISAYSIQYLGCHPLFLSGHPRPVLSV